MDLIIRPTLLRPRNTIIIPSDKLELFAADEVRDNVSIYQKLFGVYSFMQLNDEKEYTLITLSGAPFMWQPYRVCSWSTTGNLTIGQQTMSACKALLQESFCVDELFKSLFNTMLQIRDNQTKLSPVGVGIVNKLITKVTEQATLGAILTLTVGKSYNPDVVIFKDGVDTNIETAFAKTIGTCRGWVELLKETAASGAEYSHLNNKSLLTEEDFNGADYVGNPIELYDQLIDNAKDELKMVLLEGGITTSEGTKMPLFLCTPSIHAAVAKAFNAQTNSIISPNPRITREIKDGIKVYYIDETPVVPMSYVSYMDRYLTGKTHLAALSLAGVINIGASFGSIPNINEPNVGIAIQQKTDLDQAGQYVMQAMSYFNAAISDVNLISATQKYVLAA